MNIGLHVAFCLVVSQGVCPGVRLLGHMIAPFLVFKGTLPLLFSTVAVSTYIPTNSEVPFSPHLIFFLRGRENESGPNRP